MPINPLTVSPTAPLTTTEALSTLLRQLPLATSLQGKIEQAANSSFLTILNKNEASLSESQLKSQVKPIILPLPGVKFAPTDSAKTSTPVKITLLEKAPLLKLQLEFIKRIQTTGQPKPGLAQSASVGNQATSALSLANNSIFEITINQQLNLSLKTLSQSEALKNLSSIINAQKNSNTKNSLSTGNTKLENITPQISPSIKHVQNTLINKPGNTVSTIVWPQHAALEKLSQTLLVSKLVQLNNQLSSSISDPYVKVLDKWIKQLISNTHSKPPLTIDNQTINREQGIILKNALKENGALWESFLKKEVSQKLSPTANNKTGNISPLNVKAQLLRIIQSLPILLSRLNPDVASQFITKDTEVWQMIFKIKQMINLQSQTSIPASSVQQQPELVINWLEQNLRLITVWLRNIEQQQTESHQQQNQQQNQPTQLRFEIPLPGQHHQQMVQIEIEQQNKTRRINKKHWKWQLKMSFDFGKDKKLSTRTQLNHKEILVTFEGGEYFENKITTNSMRQLASNLNQQTDLEASVKFICIKASAKQILDNKLNLEV